MNQIARRGDSPVTALQNELMERYDELRAVLPRNVAVDDFVRVTLNAIGENPYIVRADRQSLFKAVTSCARDGLVPDGNEAYFDVRKKKTKDGDVAVVVYIPMLAGLRKAIIGGDVVDWWGDVVREGDEYDVERGDNPHFTHKADPFKDVNRPIIGAYSIARLRDGSLSREFMSMAEIAKARSSSSSYNSKGQEFSPWTRWEDRMCIKTVMRRHSDRLTKTAQAQAMLAADKAADILEMGEAKAEAPRRGRMPRPAQEALPAPKEENGQWKDQSESDKRPLAQSSTAQSAANGTSHSEPQQTKKAENAVSSAQPAKRGPGRPSNAEVAARQQSRQEHQRPEQTEIEGSSDSSETDPIDAARASGAAAYELGIDRDSVPRELRAKDRFDEMNAWLEGWDSEADDSAAGRHFA